MRIARLFVVLAVTAVMVSGLAACGSSSAGKGGTIEDISWDAQAYADSSGAMVDAPVTVPIDALFEGGTVAGKSGCSNYTGSYTASGSSLTVGPLASTKMACDQVAMDAETAYLAALQAAEGNKSRAAAILRIHRVKLHEKLKRYRKP